MLIDSYDAQGIKFGILVSNEMANYIDVFNKDNLDKITKAVNIIIEKSSTRIIDFSALDGLTCKEVHKAMGFSRNTPIIFVIYNSYETINSFNQKFVNNSILQSAIIRNIADEDKLIDEVVEETILENYKTFDKTAKRQYKCFLQRYRYGTKEKTDEFINQYIKK